MKNSVRSLAAVWLTLALAGCAGATGDAKTGSSSAAPPTFDENTGAVHGRVVDDEQKAVVGAQALLKESGVTTVSDAEGGFTLSNVAPGAYTLFVAMLGYDSVARRVDVKVGDTTEISIVLRAIPIATAWVDHLPFDGYFECTWRGPLGSGPCFYGIQDLSDQFPNQKRAFYYNIYPHMRTWIGELTWKTSSVATGQTISEFLSYANRTDYHTWGSQEGLSPVRLTCSRTATVYDGCSAGGGGLSEKPEIPEKGIYARHWVTTGRADVGGQHPVGYGISLQQSFKLYATVFYGDPAPEGYTGIPDA